MKEKEEIDYSSKVLNFMAMTETNNPEIATKYLEESKWDETIAVNQFFSKINTKDNINQTQNIYKNDNIIEKIDNNNSNKYSFKREIDFKLSNDLSQNLIDKNINGNKNKENNIIDNTNCFNKYIFDPIKSFFCSCCKRSETEGEEDINFQLLPNNISDFILFCESIKKKIGIIIIYQSKNSHFLNQFINQVCQNTLIINLLKENYTIFPVKSNSNEGIKIQNVVGNKELIYPIFFFCYNYSKNVSNSNFKKTNIISKLESESITLDTFYSILIDNYEKIKNIINNKKNEDNFNSLTDAEVLNLQKSEMEELEKQVQKREEELKNQKLIEEKQKKLEEELFKQKEEKMIEEAKIKVVDEPNEDNPDATTISFRYPDGEKRKNRRFLKIHTIQNLYDFVESLGNEIYTEEENHKFSLYQPFPPKKFEEMNNTLENEGLFPNAVIQIKEEE